MGRGGAAKLEHDDVKPDRLNSVTLRWPCAARPSKGDGQFLEGFGHSSFEARGACHRAALRADPLARTSG
jgi:hypothetical protein